MNHDLCFITVTGTDKVGILARITDVLYQNRVNIVDSSQRIVQDYFIMGILVDLGTSPLTIDEFILTMASLEKEMGVKIVIQHKGQFKHA